MTYPGVVKVLGYRTTQGHRVSPTLASSKSEFARRAKSLGLPFCALAACNGLASSRRRHRHSRLLGRASLGNDSGPLLSWHVGRLSELSTGLDWSRCFVSVLFVDAPCTPSYVRARLAQRLADGAAEWNGMGRILEFYSCSASPEPVDSSGVHPFLGGGVQAVVSEFADNVGIDRSELEQILRKLGSGMWAELAQEDLREHDVIIAMDSEAAAAVDEELVRQGVQAGGRTMLLSDFECLFLRDKQNVIEAVCPDGSGATFLTEQASQALTRRIFEFGEDSSNAQDIDAPPWPTRPVGLESDDGSLSEWRRLHATLLRGSWGVVWFLLKSWRKDYSNPLAKVLDHSDAIKSMEPMTGAADASQDRESDVNPTLEP